MVMVAPAVRGQTPPAALTTEDAGAWLDGLVAHAIRSGDVAGAVVVVVKDGKPIVSKGYGYADVAAKKPVDPAATLFRPGSVTKLLTWTAVMQLVEQGKVGLDRDINAYLDFKIPPRDGKPVTLRNLMTHTGGFEEARKGTILTDEKQLVPIGEALKRFVPRRIFAPGEVPAYSNYGAALAGYIVERVSGMPYDAYLEKHILRPLGMDHSTTRQPLPEALRGDMSNGYRLASEAPMPFELISTPPAGSLSASGADMARFMIAHLRDGQPGDAQILQPATLRQMHDFEQASIPGLNPSALGFYRHDRNGQKVLTHAGDLLYFHSALFLVPGKNVGLFVSANSTGRYSFTETFREAVFRGFMDRYFPPPTAMNAAKALPSARQHSVEVAGTYLVTRRSESSFMRVISLLYPMVVTAGKDGELVLPLLTGDNGAPKRFREVEPYLWQEMDGQDRIGALMKGGKVLQLGIEPLSAVFVYQRATPWQALVGNRMLHAFCFIVLMATALLWPVAALVRRRCGKAQSLASGARLWYRLSRSAALLWLIFLGGFVSILLIRFEDQGAQVDGWQHLFQLLGALALFGVIPGAANAYHAWRGVEGRGLWRRVNSLVILAALLLECVLVLGTGILNPSISF
jgi:CubicO group peptidase (beta-lactamase class C family)